MKRVCSRPKHAHCWTVVGKWITRSKFTHAQREHAISTQKDDWWLGACPIWHSPAQPVRRSYRSLCYKEGQLNMLMDVLSVNIILTSHCSCNLCNLYSHFSSLFFLSSERALLWQWLVTQAAPHGRGRRLSAWSGCRHSSHRDSARPVREVFWAFAQIQESYERRHERRQDK